jgi:RNA polymerase sigma-70 factor, ECF subfamily
VLLVQFNDGHWVASEVTTKQNDPTWEEILAVHGQMAVLTAWRILGRTQDTEDVVQESWMECLRLRSSGDIQDWGAAIRVITTRRAIDRLRKRAKEETRFIHSEWKEHPVAPEPSPETSMYETELAEGLRRAIAVLTEHEATVFSLSCLCGESNSEIASTLKISPSNVSSTLHKAREKLRTLLASFVDSSPTLRHRS